MLDAYIFAAASIFTVFAALAVFFQRSLMRAALCLALAFLGSAGIFLSVGQTLLGLLQLFVFVGGLSTYLIVAVSSEHKEHVNHLTFILLAIVIAAGLMVVALSSGSTSTGSTDAAAYVAYAFQSYALFIFVIVIAVFAAAIGSLLVIRRYVRLVL